MTSLCFATPIKGSPSSAISSRGSRKRLTLHRKAQTLSALSNAAKQPIQYTPKRPAQIKDILTQDFKQRQYLVTGKLTEEIYTKFCRISDPTGVIWGIQLYKIIIARLFDPKHSSVRLKKISVTGPSTIEAVWSKEGFLQLPWTPYLTTQEGRVIYTLNEAGLICGHKQIWTNMTAFQGIKLALTPCKRPE